MRIRNKRHFYELAKKGLVGNTLMMWDTFEEYKKDRHAYPVVTFRGLQLGLFDKSVARVTGSDIDKIVKKYPISSYIIMEVPTEGLQDPNRFGIQGELSWFNGQWCLYYADRLGYMRRALELRGRHILGWKAKELIEKYASPSGSAMLFDLFEKFSQYGDYPVIEFAIVPASIGYYRQDVIIWEVRNGY